MVTVGPYQVASGHGSQISFYTRVAAAHTITATVVGDFGMFQHIAKTVNVTAQPGIAEAGVVWEKLIFVAGENLLAKISARDSHGTPTQRIVWTLYRNSSIVYSGEGSVLNYTGTQAGLYRIKGVAYGNDGSQLSFDSSAFVQGAVNVRHNLPVPESFGTMVYIGSVFTQNITTAAGRATYLPYKTASSTEEMLLLPGTTHWNFDLDPEASPVDDEVVVRTPKGNWCLNGLAGGLTGEDIGYDYGYMPTMIPAPINHRIRLTAEMFKVNGLVYNDFNSRVRVNCYRVLDPPVYRYERCTYSSLAGGEGRRTRRWAAVFTNLNVQTDVFSGLNRMGTNDAVIPYSTVNVTSVPLVTLTAHGTPNPVPGYSGLFYTDSNVYAYYESDGKVNIAANAISAIEGVRPCCISLLTFANAKPLISNRIKRLYGKMLLFLTDGAVFPGSVVNIKIYRADGLWFTNYSVPVTTGYFVDADDTILKVAEADIDLSDYQFDETGVVVEFTVDESAAVITPIPSPVPTPITGPDNIYSTTYSHTINYDGACYTNPAFVPVLDDYAVVVSPIGGCQDPSCGPNALYCYTALYAPSENEVLPQPLGMPAPFVAYGTNPARCFYNPIARGFDEVVMVGTGTGTLVSTDEFFGSYPIDIWAYHDGSLCGYSYKYDTCNSYGPCTGPACSIIVVYPPSASPHNVVSYGGNCFAFAGSTQDYGTRMVVGSGSVVPSFDCATCGGMVANGSVVVYNDTQTFLEVPVRFDNVRPRIPHYAVGTETFDEGYSGLDRGKKVFRYGSQPNLLIYTSRGTGSMMFEFGLSGVRKQIIVDHNGAQTVYSPGMGGTKQIVTLQPGDHVYIRIVDGYNRLPLQYRGLNVTLRWYPIEFLPRLFDTTVMSYGGSTTIRALGFCAYTSEGYYSYYGTLPFNGSMIGPVNPDSLVTVTGQDGQEYNLVSVRAEGDPTQAQFIQMPWYSGQVLNGPFTFKFYAARRAFGGHGEMDVWLDTNGTFPAFLRAGFYDVLELSGSYYRKQGTPFDTHRNAYHAAGSYEASTVSWPAVYVDVVTGQVVTANTKTPAISV